MIRHVPLLSGFTTASMTSPYVSPEMPRNIEDALVIVTVESITGTPTGMTVTPTFEVWHSHVGTQQDEVVISGTGLSPVDSWFPIAAATNPSMMPDGDWPVGLDVVGAITVPVATFRRIGGGFPWRLRLAWAFTAGTTPAARISAMAYCREILPAGFDRVESSS